MNAGHSFGDHAGGIVLVAFSIAGSFSGFTLGSAMVGVVDSSEQWGSIESGPGLWRGERNLIHDIMLRVQRMLDNIFFVGFSTEDMGRKVTLQEINKARRRCRKGCSLLRLNTKTRRGACSEPDMV